MNWKVTTISGYAGGKGDESEAVVTLRVETQSNTIEQVRAKVEALPDLLECAQAIVTILDNGEFNLYEHSEWWDAIRAAIAKAEGKL